MKRKIVIAITGASGSIYADLLLKKLQLLNNQWDELGLVMTTNAREVWKIELKNDSYTQLKLQLYTPLGIKQLKLF